MFAVAKCHFAGHNRLMRIAIVDESAARASVIEDGLRDHGDAQLFVITERAGLMARLQDVRMLC